MSLPILVALVVMGISIAVAAVHFTGGSVKARLTDSEQARIRFWEDFPDEEIAEVHLTRNAAAAILELDGSRLGIVQRFGDKFLTRIVSAKDVAYIGMLREGTVLLKFHDFTWGGGEFRFAQEETPRIVRNVLGYAHKRARKLF